VSEPKRKRAGGNLSLSFCYPDLKESSVEGSGALHAKEYLPRCCPATELWQNLRRTSVVNFDQYLESPMMSIVIKEPLKGE
jgi:hypothetical protein